MNKEEKTTAVIGLIVIIAVLLVVIAVAGMFLYRNYYQGNADRNAPAGEDPETAAALYIGGIGTGAEGEKYTVSYDGKKLCIDVRPSTEDGILLYEQLLEKWSADVSPSSFDDTTGMAVVPVSITCPDTELIADAVTEKVRELLEERAASTTNRLDLYTENDEFRQDVLDEVFKEAMESVCADAGNISVVAGAQLNVEYSRRKWYVANTAAAGDTLDARAEAIRQAATAQLEYIPVNYTIPEEATAAPAPDQTKFGETEDPSVVSALLETKEAKRLIGDRQLVWNPEIEFISGKKIRYYLDDSILMIQWSETEAKAVGTFSEVIIADGSQIRRKIAGDSFGDMNFKTASELASDCNAVLAVGGDFYNHARNCGIVVYNRGIYRFDPSTCDVCYITTDGDMLFSYRNQFSSMDETKEFIDENDVLFSISFGPVLIDNGVDVTPSEYTWGEINDTYARSALGMLDRHHYLTMNINCELPHRYFLATLRQAADAMVKRGCVKAYTLDGGQTATTVVNGQLVNPVQFGKERTISDIVYFATAIPENAQ